MLSTAFTLFVAAAMAAPETPLTPDLDGTTTGIQGSTDLRGSTAFQGSTGPNASERSKPTKRRVLYTTGGGIIRGKSRLTESGAWQVKLKRGWTDLPAAAVESASAESDLLDELETRKKDEALPPADLLEWTLGAGLLKEAFALGDRLLAEFTAAPRAEVLAALKADLRSRKTGRRSFASLAMGRLFPTEDPRALLMHAVYDPAKEVRKSAALGLADMGSKEVCGPLVKALMSQNSTVRLRATEALGTTRDSLFVEPLMERVYMMAAQGGSRGGAQRPPRAYVFIGTQRAYVQDFDVEVAAGSSVADPVVNTLMEGSVLGASVISLETVSLTIQRRALLGALSLTAGQTPGRGRLSDWKAWWESEDSSSFRAAAKSPEVGKR